MTLLGRWMVLPALVGMFLGILRGQIGLSLVSLSVILWLLVEWFWFTWRVWAELPQLSMERTVNGRSESTGLLWAGRLIQINVTVRARRGSLSPMLQIRDVLPDNVEVIRMEHDISIRSRFSEVKFSYHARVRGAGRLRLPGFRVIAYDAHGFFRIERFISCVQVFRVLPAYADAGDHQPLVKRVNSLPQHGIHRLQRSGMGSELLELRDYADGDPPKSIAWKVSARRDRLMTRQYESEVPVRVQLFLDGSMSTRLGGFGCRLLDQMTYVAASVARTAALAGDPVGATLFDERGQKRISPLAGERGFHRLLEVMSDFCVNPAPLPDRLTPLLLQYALSLASEQFPELLDARVNRIPWTLFPLLPWSVRRHQDRCRLAGVLSELYRMPLSRHVQLIHDDGLMATFAQHFLSQSGLAWLTPVVSIRGRGFHDGLTRMNLLSRALTTATLNAKDNEVFVIFSDLLEGATSISHLMPAVKMALARHHRVAVVCPTPTFRRPTAESAEISDTSSEALLLAAEQTRARELSSQLQRELRRVGAVISFSGEQQAIRMVLAEMDLARSGRVAAAGARR
ncbi:MAG: DUF58 domain-containing protein [Planctomycetota bacterium]